MATIVTRMEFSPPHDAKEPVNEYVQFAELVAAGSGGPSRTRAYVPGSSNHPPPGPGSSVNPHGFAFDG
jgi:hypothetical protein